MKHNNASFRRFRKFQLTKYGLLNTMLLKNYKSTNHKTIFLLASLLPPLWSIISLPRMAILCLHGVCTIFYKLFFNNGFQGKLFVNFILGYYQNALKHHNICNDHTHHVFTIIYIIFCIYFTYKFILFDIYFVTNLI